MTETLLDFFNVTTTAELVWVVVGLCGQLVFTMRFVVQWIASEKERRVVVPELFWWFSIVGGVTLFVYAVHRGDPVFMLGQGLGVFIYFRNLWLIYAEKRSLGA